ncbi:hypothetical protein [Aureimonas sp. AU4]|uniref:hypothetical protein n=1 Tax=Aureimonas sp. AU4 TaxID=1638163 RepID=UPI000785796E|nr:hypothetical protein [Aureimonas sp. AU4]
MTNEERAALEAIAQGELGRQFGIEARHLDVAASMAGDLARRGAHDRALRLYATIVLCDPQHRAAQAGLASGALEVGAPYIAIQAAAVLIAGAPDDPLGYLLSGKGCLLAQEWPEAREDLQRASDLAGARGDGNCQREADMLLAGLSAHAAQSTAAPAVQFG